MGKHSMTEAVEGEVPFKCYVCGKMLAISIEGDYIIKMQCPRCKTKITLETERALPDTLVVKHGALTQL